MRNPDPVPPGAQSLDLAEQILSRYDGAPLKLERRDASLVVTPELPDAFEITLYDQGDEAMVAAERWHSHYDDPGQAAFCALWLLTPYYRVVHELKGGVLAAVWIERYEAEGWEPMDPVFFLNPDDEPSWALRPNETFTRRYHQQAILPPPQPYGQIVSGANLDTDGFPPDFVPGVRVEESAESKAPR